MLWIQMQDDTRLLDIVPLTDGRDFLVFERLYVRQTYQSAVEEADRFTEAMRRVIPMQHDTNRHAKPSTIG